MFSSIWRMHRAGVAALATVVLAGGAAWVAASPASAVAMRSGHATSLSAGHAAGRNAVAGHAAGRNAVMARPVGPCDIYAAGGTPCVAAHSTTRALYASYDGPLYQVKRSSDGATRNIGVVPASRTNPGGYADAAAQDAFCANTTCLITKIYDQSPEHNDLTQAPRGNFSGPALAGQNNLPVATMAPVTVAGHKVYGVYIEPGMGLRDNNTNGIAVDDQPEGMYMIVDGHHFNDGCCFDYGNGEIDSHDDGNGTMETSYFGNATAWFHGAGTGPWVMTDQENNLVGCSNFPSTSKICQTLPNITSRFVTAMAKGDSTAAGTLGSWESQAGDAQSGPLSTMFSGERVDQTYAPMRKQGGIVLGNGGDNSNAAQGTFYEGVMTSGFPSDATDAAVQANIVAAKYNVQQLSLTGATDTATPDGVQSFTPGSTQKSVLTYTNTSSSAAANVTLRLSVPGGWKSNVDGANKPSASFASVAPGASVSATFDVTAGRRSFNGDLTGVATWGGNGAGSVTATEAVRSTDPIVINEFQTAGQGNSTNAFIELFNSGSSAVNISNWTLTEHAAQAPSDSTIRIPSGTVIGAGKTYVLGLASSGLAAPATAGSSTISLRSTTGLQVGDQVQIGSGSSAETRTITAITNTGATGPRVPGEFGNALQLNGDGEFAQLPDGIVQNLHDFTISTWVNPSANLPWSRIFDFGTGTSTFMFLTLNSGGGPLIFSDTNPAGVVQTLFAPGQLPLNTWSNVAVTLSGSTGTLYINGKAVDTETNMTTTPADLGDTTNNWIGHSQFVADPFLDAKVDDFNIYDHALTADQIAALASGQPGAGNVLDLKFDEDSGATALDSSGNGNNATIFGVGEVSTPLWQPLPDGPITIPRGSTTVPVTNTSGFSVGEKISLGFGSHLDTATVTSVGTSGGQEYLAAPAAAGDTNVKVTATDGIFPGARLHLDIGSRRETVTVASVGTAGSDGTGVTLAAPLRFSHSSNLPFSAPGTGISFTPATRFAHSSDDPVQAIGSSITLNEPLSQSLPIDSAVVDSGAGNVGFQGTPDLWFGGPALSTAQGTMALRDAEGQVADSLNYGGIVDPVNQEGYQGASGTGRAGCFAPAPPSGRSTARDPDGANTDSNCADFFVSPTPTPGASNEIELEPGQLVSLESAAPGATNTFVTHDDADDVVVTSQVTAASSIQQKEDSTFVETVGNNTTATQNVGCVSFESVNRPGEFLRHQNFVLHLQPSDGTALFDQDSTFCPQTGNNGQGTSFQSDNFAGRFLRMFQGGMFLAGDGIDSTTGNAFDTATGWTDDTSWLVQPALASTSQPMTSSPSTVGAG